MNSKYSQALNSKQLTQTATYKGIFYNYDAIIHMLLHVYIIVLFQRSEICPGFMHRKMLTMHCLDIGELSFPNVVCVQVLNGWLRWSPFWLNCWSHHSTEV